MTRSVAPWRRSRGPSTGASYGRAGSRRGSLPALRSVCDDRATAPPHREHASYGEQDRERAAAPRPTGPHGNPSPPPVAGAVAGRPSRVSVRFSSTSESNQPPSVRSVTQKRWPGGMYVTGSGLAYG